LKKYISSDVLAWHARAQSGSLTNTIESRQCYSYWNHANQLLSHGFNSHYLIDCITNLNRAIDQRIKHLTFLYQFKKLPNFGQSRDLLSLFGQLDIARPYMLHQINELRNLLEHQYKTPPNVTRCQELVDFTWYFLKSTDSMSTLVPFDFVLSKDEGFSENDHWLEVDINPKDTWKCYIRGTIPLLLCSDQSQENTFIVNCKKIESATSGGKIKINGDEISSSVIENGDIYFSGEIEFTKLTAEKIVKLYFSIS
jgi:hypothetical protein